MLRRRILLFLVGVALSIAQFVMVRDFVSILYGEEVVFPWCPGDRLLLDNVLASHGRKPFRGERRILVAMA